MERAMQSRAVVGQRRAEQSKAAVGQCAGCSRPPSNCACVPLGPTGQGLGYVPPIDIGMIPQKLLGTQGQIAPAMDWYTASIAAAPYPCVPYEDAIRDCLMMTPISSRAPVVVAVGASALLTIGPIRGWFDAFYFDISVLDPATGLSADPASYRLTPPRVADCPQPCDTTAQRGTFWEGEDGCCCGRPFRALIGRTEDSEALTFTFTNDGIAPVSVQAIARGWCHARSLCLF